MSEQADLFAKPGTLTRRCGNCRRLGKVADMKASGFCHYWRSFRSIDAGKDCQQFELRADSGDKRRGKQSARRTR